MSALHSYWGVNPAWAQTVVLPAETLNLTDISSLSSDKTWGVGNGTTNAFYADNEHLIVYGYAASRDKGTTQKWLSGTELSETSYANGWTATGIFKGSSYYASKPRKANLRNTARNNTFRVTKCSGASALVAASGSTAEIILEAYEVSNGIVSTTAEQQGKITGTNIQTVSITGLSANKEYVIFVYGSTGSNASLFEIAFDISAGSSPATVSIAETTLSTGVGNPVTLKATVGGNPAPTVQWYQCDDADKTNATAIDGATTTTYEYTPIATGTYYFYCTATNESGEASSEVVTVNVTEAVAVTATFPFDLGTEGQTATFTSEDITNSETLFNGSYVTIGTGFTGYSLKTLTAADSDNSTVKETAVTTTADGKLPATDGVNNVDFMITLKKGLKFTPTAVSYRATRHGTGDGYIDTYWVNGDGTTIELAKGQKPERDNGDDGTGRKYTDYQYNITSASETEGTCGLRLFVYQVSKKAYGFCNITIEGFVTGEAEEETLYTITSTVNLDGSGTVKMTPASGVVAEGQSVELTATANTGYKFMNWTDATSAVLSTDNPYTFTPTADATITANFEKLTAVTFAMGDAENGIAPDAIYGDAGESVKIPANVFMYSAGKTLKGWTDGASTYSAGQTLTLGTDDITLTPVFEANTTDLASTKDDVTVTWSFQTNNGAPTFNYENGSNWNDVTGNAYYVIPTIVNGTSIDVAMQFETRSNKTGLSGNGKINNIGRTSDTQINGNTVFTVPVTNGCVIELKVSNNYKITTTTINGTKDYTAGQTIQYTYMGTDPTTQIVIGDGSYYEYIKVTYPGTTCVAPTYTTGNFNFEHHATPVTFTAKEGMTLMVSVDDAEATAMESPATVYPAAKATAYTTAEGMDNSDVTTAEITNDYDAAKPYVAWVYTSTYASVKDGFADDRILNGLKENYNVVLVDYPDAATPSDDLNNADLIVCTESMAGGKTMSNGMKKFVGVTPMVNLKMYNYTSGRWSWGTPNNPGKDIIGFTPTSKYYKILDGVTFEEDGNVNFYTIADAATDDHIQTAAFTSAPEDNVIMGTVAVNGEAAMHCMNKFFGLGLSSNTWKEYNDNAVIVIKNAAAMLLAGEALDTEVYPDYTLTTADNDLYSLYLGYDATIPAGIEAYTGTLSADETTLTLKKIEDGVIPARTGVVVKSPETTGGFTFAHSETAGTATSDILGVLDETPIAELETEGKVVLTLGLLNGEAGFRKPAGTVIKANRIYLVVSEPTTSEAKGVRIVMDGDKTGISEINTDGNETDAPAYNMAGQRVAAGTKGLLIKNGKKYIAK